MRRHIVQRTLMQVWSFLTLLTLVVVVFPAPLTKAAERNVSPFAALLDSERPEYPVLSLAFHPDSQPHTFALPAGITLVDQPNAAARLVEALQSYPFDVTDSALLRFDGNLEPTTIPTITPVVIPSRVAVSVPAAEAVIGIPVGDPAATVVLSVQCRGVCAPDWYGSVLAQLPPYAPVVVVASQTASCPGLWQVRAAATGPQVVTVLTTLPDQVAGSCTFTSSIPTTITPPVRTVVVDGTMTLLRVVFCLVAVLLLSVGSFYGALALTKRMHAAVGFRQEER